ncbi:MAG: hypothetical protein FJ358_01150 [Thaumarchaeota archaeon]|nr:hypothetical protein [Nitrososphaerota archaeon]
MNVDTFTAPTVVFAAAVVPSYIGLLTALVIAKRVGSSFNVYAASIASGISFALFFDLVANASGLGLNLAARVSITQVVLIGSFLVGLLALFGLDARTSNNTSVPPFLISIIAIGIGFHSVAEGIVIGYDVRTAGFSQDVATITQGLSFALHKAAEGFVIGSFLTKQSKLSIVIFAGAIAALPGVLGALLGSFGIPGIISSYFFAMGAGAAIYTLTKLIPTAISEKNKIVMAIGIALGYLFIYGAGLIHNI